MEDYKDKLNGLDLCMGLYSGLIITEYAVPILKNRIRIHREQNIDHITVYMVPSECLQSNLTKPKKHLIKKEFSIYMNNFIRELKNNIPNINLNAFYENSKNLEFDQIKVSFFRRFLSYDLDTVAEFGTNVKDMQVQHKISFFGGNQEESIWHEFLHMASQRLYGCHVFTGFKQKYTPSNKGEKPFSIGQGLNEGYTEVLADRYFTKYGSKSSSSTGYKLTKNMALIIEKIIGKEKMEKMYFESNLYGLCYILKDYDDINEIICFLKQLDIIESFINKSGSIAYCKKLYKKALSTLLFWYLTKIKNEIITGSNPINSKKLFDKETLDLFTNRINHVKGLSNKEIKELINIYFKSHMYSETSRSKIM